MEDRDKIQSVLDTYGQARVAGDADLWLSLWDEAGLQLPHGAGPRSIDALRDILKDGFGAADALTFDVTTAEIIVRGDLAFAHGTYTSDQRLDGEVLWYDGNF